MLQGPEVELKMWRVEVRERPGGGYAASVWRRSADLSVQTRDQVYDLVSACLEDSEVEFIPPKEAAHG